MFPKQKQCWYISLSSSVQFSSVAQSCPTLCDPMNHSKPGFPVHHQLPEFTEIHVHRVSDAIQPSRPLSSLLLLSSIPPSIRDFSNESTLRVRWPKYWSFSVSIIPSKVIPELIAFRMDWLDLLAIQGTLKSLFQHHSSKASILRRSAFFTIQLSHPHITTGETIALNRQNFVDKVMSLLLNMLSRLVIIFLPRSKHLLIAWRALFEQAKPFDFHPEGNREQHSECWCWSVITSFVSSTLQALLEIIIKWKIYSVVPEETLS